MLEKDLDIIYNKEYLVIVPKMTEHLLDAFQYSFGNVILMNNSVEEIRNVTEFINKNNFKQLILVDYQLEYEEVINNLIRQHDIKIIFTKSLGSLCEEFSTYVFNSIHRLYENGIASKIGFLDKNFYETLKHKGENVEFIQLDIEKVVEEEEYDENRVGLLNNSGNSKHSFYNELSGIKLSNKYSAKLYNPDKTTKKFLKLFNINHTITSKEELYKNNLVNLYVNFTDNNNLEFIKSMDYGVPCILGNNQLLNNEKTLQELLVMKSDDDIDEISSRISLVAKNREKIIDEYKKFREKYTKESKESIKKFIGINVKKEAKEDDELLLTVVVPAWNVEKYIANTLDSILAASIDSMEILIINDGSTDETEKEIKPYLKKYPELIRYISQDNHGLGNVRNVGLKEARGKYIASIDSDDTINIDFFQDAEEYLQKDIDIVMYDWLTVTNTDSYETSASDWIFNNNQWSRYEALLYTTIMPSACNKIIKKKLYKELDINYIEDKFEDLSTTPFIMLKAETIKYYNKQYYEYYIRSNSLMRTSAGYSMIDVIKLVNERLEKYKEYLKVDIDDFKYYTYSWRIEEYVLNQLYTIDEKEINTFLKYIMDNLKDVIIDIFNNKRYKELLSNLSEKHKAYIEERNKAFLNNELEKFIIKARKKDDYFKLTPPIIYYGENQ